PEPLAFAVGEGREVLQDRVEDPPRDVAGAERVHVARVRGAGKGRVGEAHLPDPAEALEEGGVDHLSLARVEEDRAVDRVTNAGRHGASLTSAGSSFKVFPGTVGLAP